MRVLIVSDTHGNVDDVIRLIDTVPFDAVIHLGDYIKDAEKLKKIYKDIDFYKVSGNNDYSIVPKEDVISVGGIKIFICHGHQYMQDTGLMRMMYKAKEAGATLCLFGHTHEKFKEEMDGVTFFNPGSPTKPRDYTRSVGILEIEEDYLGICHYEIK